MTTQKAKRFVLLIDQAASHLRRTALDIAGDDGAVLIAHTVESALNFAKNHKPSHALVLESQTQHEGKFLPALLLEFSPHTEVMIVGESEHELEAAIATSA